MSLSFLLDIIIGLIFIFLVLSLLSSGVQELLATLLQWRAAHLKKAIEILIAGGDPSDAILVQTRELLKAIYNSALIGGLRQESREGIEAWLRKVTRAIISAGRDNNQLTLSRERNEPSYIPSETFAMTLLEKLDLAQLSTDLTALKLRLLLERDISSGIEKILDHYSKTMDVKNLKSNFEQHKERFNEILDALKIGRISLQTSVYQFKNELEQYIRDASNELKSQESNQAEAKVETPGNLIDRPLIRDLTILQESIFYADRTFGYSNINEIISKLQPSLSEVLALFYLDKNSDFQQSEKLGKVYKAIQEKALEIAKTLPPALQDSLVILAKQAELNLPQNRDPLVQFQDELKQFKSEIQKWFDRSMERASGVYKRNAKGICFLIGFGLAIAINADTFHMTNRLATDATLRNVLVANANLISQACNKAGPPSNSSNDISLLNCISQKVQQEVPLPLGWSKENTTLQDQEAKNSQIPLAPVLRKLLGWLITGFAISMGATFWFETLCRVMNVRNTGKKPESQSNTDQPSNSPNSTIS